jgi:hypothetical protein
LDTNNLINLRLPLFTSSSPEIPGEELFQLYIRSTDSDFWAKKDFAYFGD